VSNCSSSPDLSGYPAADPYAALELTADADDEQLRRAYRRLARHYHPDHNGGAPEAVARFQQLQAAYAEILRRRAAALSPEAVQERQRLAQRLAALQAEVVAAKSAERRGRRIPRPLRGTGRVSPTTDPLVTRVNSLIEGLDHLASMIDSDGQGR